MTSPPPESPVADANAGAVRFATPAGRWVLLATVMGSGIAFLDSTVVNVALPAIGRDLDAGVSDLQWTVNGYLLTLAALILLGGALGDRYGRRRVFVTGVAWFAVASALCALAPSADALILARALQGVGGALLTPGSLAIIQASFRPEDRARAIGAWSALTGVAVAIGPLLGGYLVDAASWRWVFIINLPIAVAVIAISARHVPESRDPGATGSPDVAGSVLATVALAGVTFGLIEGPGRGFGTPIVAAAIVIGVAAAVAFVMVERRVESPMLRLEVFRSRQFVSANGVTFTVYGALGGVFFLLVVFLQSVLGYSPLEAGAASLPVTVLMLLLSSRAGQLAQRIGPRVPLTVGPTVLAIGMVMMAGIDAGSTYVTGVLPAVVVFGLGLSCTVSPVTATALAAVEVRWSGIASAVNNAVSRAAQLLAVAVLPVVVGLQGADFQDPAAFTAGFRSAMFVAAGLSLVGAAIAWFTISNDLLERGPAPPARRHCGVEGAPLRSG